MKNAHIIERLAALTLSSIILVGCATIPPYAREVKKKPTEEGVIALKQDFRPEDRAKADALMAANCAGKRVNVLEEGEQITGTTTSSNAKKTNDREHGGGLALGMFTLGGADRDAENTSVNTSTTHTKEWQIIYRCESASSEKATAANGMPVKKGAAVKR